MKIAVTYDNGHVWQHFGKTKSFKFYEVTEGKVLHSEMISTGDASHGVLADFLASHGAEVVICGGVGAPMVNKLEAKEMKVFAGVTGNADDAVQAFLDGTLIGSASAIHEGCHHHNE